MPTDQTPTDISLAGVLDTTVGVAADGNTFTNTGYEFAEIINGAGAPITVTVDVYPSGGPGAPGGYVVTNPEITVANGTRKRIGPFRKRDFNNAAEKVLITTSSQTTITMGVYRLTPTP